MCNDRITMISQISKILQNSINSCLGGKTAIAFSGGIDSSVILTILKNQKNIGVFCLGTEKSQDLENSRKIAQELKIQITEIVVEEKEVLGAYGKIHEILPLDLLIIEILIPVYLVAKAASEAGYKTMLFGSGAEEVFAGYEKYYRARDEGKDVSKILEEEFQTLPERDIKYVKTICSQFGIEAKFPFYNEELANLMFFVPVEKRLDNRLVKKGILREAAKLLNVPKLAIERKKQAMQYGSGIHKIILKNADELNKKYPVK